MDTETALAAAVAFYRARIESGQDKREARQATLAYLRRKTQWGLAMAAGAFDTYLHKRGTQ